MDANIFIYAVNAFAPFDRVVGELFDAVDDGKMSGVTSELSVAELLVIPFRNRDANHERQCRRIVAPRPGFVRVDVTATVLEKAARLRAASRALRLPDAIHLATAVEAGCKLFLTNDQRLTAGQQHIRVELLSNLIRP